MLIVCYLFAYVDQNIANFCYKAHIVLFGFCHLHLQMNNFINSIYHSILIITEITIMLTY